MGLNYTDGCVNFRDVGGYLNLITSSNRFKEGVLFRGGSIDYVNEHKEIGYVKTIINLRNGEDSHIHTINYLHFPMSNKVEKYDTSHKEVRRWLSQIIKEFDSPGFEYPVLIHCLSGKDRTGIVIALLLDLIGVERKFIIEEYLLSIGEVKRELIEMSLNGFEDKGKYFEKLNLTGLKKKLSNRLLN